MSASDSCAAAPNPFSVEQLHALKGLTIASAVLSVLGSAFIVVSFLLPQPRRSVGLKIIFHLSTADLLASMLYIIDGSAPTTELATCGGLTGLCAVCAAGQQFFGLATILWTGCIALSLHLSVLMRLQMVSQQPEKLMRRMSGGVWGSCAFTLVVLAGARALGSSGQWCWIHKDAQWARLAFYYLPLMLVFCYSMAVYVATRRTLLRMHHEATVSAAAMGTTLSHGAGAVTGLTSRLRFFLLIFAIIHVSQIANRIFDAAFPERPSFVLTLLQSTLSPLQGVGNALAYGWNPRVRRVWSTACPKWCGWLEPREPTGEQPGRDAHAGAGACVEITPAGVLREDSFAPLDEAAEEAGRARGAA